MKTPDYLKQICEDAVEDCLAKSEKERNANVGMFTISGKAKHVKEFSFWLAKITAGLTIAEAVAVVSTAPTLMKNIENLPNVKVRFNTKGLRNCSFTN
jgi:hypothetical protein